MNGLAIMAVQENVDEVSMSLIPTRAIRTPTEKYGQENLKMAGSRKRNRKLHLVEG